MLSRGEPSVYDLEFLPVAQRDMSEIVRYISQELKNPNAAEILTEKLISAAESAREFPYAAPVYFPIRPVKYEYRKLIVQKYLIFYRVDEVKKKITVARVIYAKRNYSGLIE